MRITPAYAGNTFFSEKERIKDEDHPRLRGEHFISFEFWVILPGSPPPTRGTLTRGSKEITAKGITPAYAGNTSPVTNA